MALNGGVSLAVWMGGSAAELDCARRAHLAPEVVDGRAPRRVYNALCEAFQRVLVIDLMSGSSAGGINGALLGAAIRHRRCLNPGFLRNRWLELGKFSDLLHRTSEPSPMALMQGDLFHTSLVKTFEDLLGLSDEELPTGQETDLPPGQESLPDTDVSLAVTTTDVVGERKMFLDYWERELVAREYRARFRFRTPTDYSPEMLAAAARASASFPIAFEPWRIEAPTGDLAGFKGSRWLLDGGLLDNAPIEAALELIPRRPFHRQVRRYVCYMNAEPPTDAGEAPPAALASPKLAVVSGYVINLPRKATFVDQLTAIERVTRTSTLQGRTTPALDLLALELTVLKQAAATLLPSYQQGRHLLSLEELFTEPARARLAHNALRKGRTRLPWIPEDLAPTRDGAWQWGLRPAERIFLLLLEVLRRAAADAPADRRLRLFGAGREIGNHLRGIEEVGACLARSDPGYGDVMDALKRAQSHLESFDPLPPLRRAAKAVHKVRADLVVNEEPVAERLFGEHWNEEQLTDAAFEHFMSRVLAIEVVRRAVAPDDEPFASGQDIRFAQLTPYAPAYIFDSNPFAASKWKQPEQKLTGLALGHFAGFYRGSWRVNDFMWGRLDGAVRVTDLLVAPGRAKQLRRDDSSFSPAEKLAAGLLACEPADAQRWLLDEALRAEAGQAPPAPGDPPPSADDLKPRLVAALNADLSSSEDGDDRGDGSPGARKPGELTRIICARAAQLEILADELAPLDDESRKDARLGAGAAPLKLPTDLRAAIVNLRAGDPLPERLTAEDEVASALALRTGTHAALVTLGVLRTATPMLRVLFALRAVLLPVAGSVAQRWWNRLGAAVAFYAATLFLSARALTTLKKGSASLDMMTLTALVVTLFASLVVLATAAVPGFRGLRARKRSRRKYVQWLLALVLVAVGGVAAVLLAWLAGGVSLGRLLTGATAQRPPAGVLYTVIAFMLGAPLAAAPAFVRGRINKIFAMAWGGLVSLIAVGVIAGLLIGYSAGDLWSRLDGRWWQAAIAIIALFVAPAVVLVTLVIAPATRFLRR